ncbi:MAG: GAF domain-containing sensor histidine kinase, partial [Mycobacteriales bacterium]
PGGADLPGQPPGGADLPGQPPGGADLPGQPPGDATLRRLLDLALSVAAEPRPERVLRTILDAARDVTGAGYAAVGVPDGGGGFALFLTSGVDARTWAAIGALPRQHGLLGVLLREPRSVRLADVRRDPRFVGWPAAHPDMGAFLGVPVIAGGEILAELYLADKSTGAEFTLADQSLVETIAAHAALAIANAQRLDRSRELAAAQERARLARDLHDSVTQTLFGLTLASASMRALAADAGPGLREQIDRVGAIGSSALEQMRDLVETLRPGDVDRDDLPTALRKRIALVRRSHAVPIRFTVDGTSSVPPAIAHELQNIAGEAIANAVNHAAASGVDVTLQLTDELVRLTVADDGTGFDVPATRRTSRRLGLTSMAERSALIGGRLTIDSAPGRGTRVRVAVGLCPDRPARPADVAGPAPAGERA